MSSDERLARRAARGDRSAFAEIYRRYDQDLYRFCLAMVGNPQDAQDTLQNAMVKVLRSLPGEERTIQLKPWLYRIVRNESIETLRKRREGSELEPHHAVAAGVTDTVEARERLRTLLADLEMLPDRQRAALVMRELGDLDYDQIGAAFGTSAAVARQTLYEARLSLRQLEAGREMRCTEVMRELSDADGRVARRREIRAHLRGCTDCRSFRDEIGRRHENLAALSPLPLATSTALFQGALAEATASGAGGAGGAGLGGVAAGAGKAAATSVVAKSVATVAVVAAVGVAAGDRSGLIEMPLSGGSTGTAQTEMRPAAAPGAVTGTADTAATNDDGLRAGDHADDPNRPGGTSKNAVRGDRQGAATAENGTTAEQETAVAAPDPDQSTSQQGLAPPGGGHGRSASEQGGKPDQLPAASAKGQENAAAHKPSNAASSPGSSSNGGQGKETAGPPTSKPSPPPHAGTAPATPPAPGFPEHAQGAGHGKAGETPPAHED